MAVDLGTPITTEQAARAILRELRTPLVGNVDLDHDPGLTLERLHRTDKELGTAPYGMLSAGEQRLVDIAQSIWTGRRGADISALGGLDRRLRRKVLVVLWYLHMGHDLAIEVEPVEFDALFGEA